MRFWVSSTLFAAAIAMSPLLKAADENFDVYVFSDVKYDDNVFRVANDAEALAQSGTTTRDDVELVYGVGANLRIPVSRQNFNVDAELRRSNFDRFSELDNNNGEFKGEWEWAYASKVNGTLGYEYERELTDFFEFSSAVRDTEVIQNIFSSANIPLSRRWDIVIGGNLESVEFDERSFLDRDSSSVYSELLFQTRAKTFIGLRLQQNETEFDSVAAQINDFDETVINVVLRWDATSKSRFSGSIGRTERNEEDDSSGDFSGITGRAEYRRIISSKTYVDFTVFRETALLDEVASLVVSSGASIAPNWKISPKLRFRGQLAFEEREFQGAGFFVDGAERTDDLFTVGGRLSYRLNRVFALNFGFRHRFRDSNDDNSEFDQTELRAGIRAKI